MRLMSLLCVLIAGLIACYGIHEGRDLIGVAALVSAFLVPAFTGKVSQKYFEEQGQQVRNQSNSLAP